MSPTAVHHGRTPDASAPPDPDPRFTERRQQVEGERRRRIRRRVVAVLVVVSVLGALWALAHSALLDVEALVPAGVRNPTEAEEVRMASGVGVGDPLVFVNPAEVAERVEQLAWVDTATVDRSWLDGNVVVAVIPRQAVAVLAAADGQWLLVDRTGQAIGVSPDAAGVPVVGGVGLDAPGQRLDASQVALVEVAASMTPGLATRVAEVRLGAGDEVELLLADGGVVLLGVPAELGEQERAVKLRTVRTMLATVDLTCVEQLDVRVGDTAILTRNPSCA